MQPLSKRTWARAVGWTAALLLLMALALFVINSSSVPQRIGRGIIDAFARTTGWQMTVERVELVGPSQLRLQGVHVAISPDASGGQWVREVDAPSVHVTFNPIGLLRGDGASAGTMTWISPQVTVTTGLREVWPVASAPAKRTGSSAARTPASDSGKGGGAGLAVEVVDGRIVDPDGMWLVDGRMNLGPTDGVSGAHIERAKLVHVDSRASLSLRMDEEGGERMWSWHATGPASLFAKTVLPADWDVTGAMTATGALAVKAPHEGTFTLEVVAGDIRWGDGTPEESLPFDRLSIAGRHDGDLHIDDLSLEHEAQTIHASGRVAFSQRALPAAPLELELYTHKLTLPSAVPLVARFGLSGEAQFNGVLAGTVEEPELSGRLKIVSGTVWHRPVDEGEGVILLRPGYFSFGQTHLAHQDATYRLRGSWDGTVKPAHLDISIDADHGNASEMLAVFGVEGTEVTGTFDGRVLVQGPVDALRVSGSVDGRDVVVVGQPFNTVVGRFEWVPRHLYLETVTAAWRGGQADVSGTVREDRLDLALSLERWPLRAPALAEAASVDEYVDGWLSYEGRVEGTLSAPTTTGTVLGGDVQVGAWRLVDPEGTLTLNQERLLLNGMRLKALGGGEYVLDGEVTGWMQSEPTLDVEVGVRGASLSTLLRESGLALPALLLAGQVDGTVVVQGPAKDPDARFDVTLSDDLGVGEPMRLRFERVDGRFRFHGMPRLLGLGGIGRIGGATGA